MVEVTTSTAMENTSEMEKASELRQSSPPPVIVGKLFRGDGPGTGGGTALTGGTAVVAGEEEKVEGSRWHRAGHR